MALSVLALRDPRRVRAVHPHPSSRDAALRAPQDGGQLVTGAGNWASESFGGRKVGVILLVLLGLTAGQGVVWYQGQFQALNFMTST